MGLFLKVVVALAAFAVMMRLGMLVLGGLARPNVTPPPGEMRRINLRFRCSICLAEVKMIQASEDLPAPPRHCQEDMELVAPPFE